MTKADIINEISAKSGIQKVEVREAIEGFIGIIKKRVIKGEMIIIQGFGTFGRKHRAEKPGRNISTKETIIIPAHDVPFFKVSPEFKDALK